MGLHLSETPDFGSREAGSWRCYVVSVGERQNVGHVLYALFFLLCARSSTICVHMVLWCEWNGF